MTDKIDISSEAVQRFYLDYHHLQVYAEMKPQNDGDWVRHEDYVALYNRLVEVEGVLKATLDREAETHKRHDARLAEVEAERDRQYDENVHRIAEQAQAEAKLAQAVEALRRISLAEQNSGTRLSDIGREARATLAEIGEGHE
jgi:hypothetical protein